MKKLNMNKILGKCAALLIPYGILGITMTLSGQPYGSGSAIASALKTLSLGFGESWGVFTLIAIALVTDSITAYLLRGL